jgi:hypothetical protein
MSRETLKRTSVASPRCPRCSGPSLATSERRKLARPMLICASNGHVWAASDAEYMQAKAADQAYARLAHIERLDVRARARP